MTGAAWHGEALCLNTDPDLFFPDNHSELMQAKAICAVCPVAAQCLKAGVDGREDFGIWGGLTAKEIKKLRKYA